MAKGKGGKSTASAGPRLRKNHGPKRHMFKDLKPMTWQFGKLGLLDKYHDFESFTLACNSRGKKTVSMSEFTAFQNMKRSDQDAYLKSLRKPA